MGELFERFWKAYPRKQAKGRAKKAWVKLVVDEDLLSRMILAIERAKKTAQWQKDCGEFIPLPATWLNDEGWEDEYEEFVVNERGIRIKNPILKAVGQ